MSRRDLSTSTETKATDLSQESLEQSFRDMARYNRFTCAASCLYRPIRRSCLDRESLRDGPSVRLLDLASGVGDLPIDWAKRAKRDKLNLEITALDNNATAVDAHRQSATEAGVSIEVIQLDCLKDPLPTGFDIVTCSMFMHQLNQHQVFCLLQSMEQASRCGALLVCDLDRSRLSRAMVACISRLTGSSPIFHENLKQAMRSAFTREQFGKLATAALARPVKVRRCLPGRFLMQVDDATVPESATDSSVAFA